MQLDLSVKKLTKNFGNYVAVDRVSFDVEDGKFFSILGPSGCGKTTLLRMIAGLHKPTSGTIEIRGQNMIDVEPNKRPVNLIFQDLALFPMMDVKENIAFGLKRRGERGKGVYQKVADMLERVGLPGYVDHKISQLSGGQKQRVAIARSLILEPSVLLLDEPLGALDLKLREHMKVELKELQAHVGTTFVYITHDQSEAMVMSNHVAVMRQGKFEQIDTPQNLYYHPASSFVAQFVGENNKFTGTLTKNDGDTFFVIIESGQKLAIGAPSGLAPGERVELFIRPEAMIINPDTTLKNINRLNVTVKSILFDGGNSRLLVRHDVSSQELIVALPQNNLYDHVKPKDHINIGWRPTSSVCFKDMGIKTYDEF
ncbi:MAG: ABC transporter ATP-binding protein [Pseudomonadota bacterium]|nr:ABC transporter ATP-binding protein [Pseudomonadota bacterium]